MRQKGFATLEVILMVMVIGILASIAVPRFTNVTAAANTAKIQTDLSTIDTAIAIYTMEKGTPPDELDDLKDYFQGKTAPKPPVGKYYVKGVIQSDSLASTDVYKVDTDSTTGDTRAFLGTNTAENFYVQKSS